MLLTDIFGRSFMDDFFEDFANSSYYRPNRIGSIPAMKADVQELGNAYRSIWICRASGRKTCMQS